MASDDLVTPDELSALLDAAPPRAGAGGAEPYDLAARLPAQDSDDLPALTRITEHFCEGFTRSLSRYLGRDALVSARGWQLREYRDFVHSLPERASVRGLDLAPLPGNGVLVLEPALLFTVVESFFGGGRATMPSTNRDLTPTERRMLGNLLDLLLPDLKAAWSPLLELSLGVAPSDVDPLLVSLIDPVEMVLVQRFEVALLGGGGDFHLALPMSALQGIWPALRAGKTQPADDSAWRAALRARLLDSSLTLRAEVARRQSTLRRVLTLQVGEVLIFERPDGARLVAEGRPLFVGEFGVSNGNNAVSVTGRLAAPSAAAAGESGKR